MHPLVRGAVAAAVLTALGSFDRGASSTGAAPTAAPGGDARGVDGLPAPCLAGTLPEGPVCVRIPGADELAARLTAAAPMLPSARGGPIVDRIPRRPERPADAAAYVYPLADGTRAPRVLADLDQPGIRLAARPGEKVVSVVLEHQTGPAEVIFVGDVFGRTVVTAHVVEEGTRTRTVLLFHGGLDHAEPGVVAGAKIEAGAELGAARTELGGGLIDVYVEAREVREGAKLDGADGKRLTDAAVSVPTDVRNVLPLREAKP